MNEQRDKIKNFGTMNDKTLFWTGGDSKAVLPGGDYHPSIFSIFEKLTNVNIETKKIISGDKNEKVLVARHDADYI